MTKYIIGEIFSSGGATLYKNPSDQTEYIDFTTSKYLIFIVFKDLMDHPEKSRAKNQWEADLLKTK